MSDTDRLERAERHILTRAVDHTLDARRSAQAYGEFDAITREHLGAVRAYTEALLHLAEHPTVHALQEIQARIAKAADQQAPTEEPRQA